MTQLALNFDWTVLLIGQTAPPVDAAPLADFTLVLVLATAAGLVLGVISMMLVNSGRISRFKNDKEEALRFQQEATLQRAEVVNERERLAAEVVNRAQEVEILNRQLQSLQSQLAQAKEGWRSSDAQIEELSTSLKGMRGQAEQLRQMMSEAERVSGERQVKVIALNSQLDESQARLSETMRVAAERQSSLAQATSMMGRQRARLAEIGYIASEVQTTLNTLSMHMDSLRQRVLLDQNEGEDTSAPVLPAPPPPPLPAPSVDSAALPAQPPEPAPNPAASAESVDPAAPSNESTAAPAADMATFSSRVSSLALNLERLSGMIGKRPGDPPPAASPADAAPVPTGPQPADPAPAAPHGVVLDGPTSTVAFAPPLMGSTSAAEMARLQGIRGVGVVYAVRLSQNGIGSVLDLSQATPDQLDAIIKAPRWRKPNYADWINQAKHMLEGDGKLEVEGPPSAA